MKRPRHVERNSKRRDTDAYDSFYGRRQGRTRQVHGGSISDYLPARPCADPLLLDLDDENRTLSRFFPEALQVEIKKKSSHDILVERALKGDSLIIADLKAGTGRDVLDWWLTCRLKNFSYLGCSICVWPLPFISRK